MKYPAIATVFEGEVGTKQQPLDEFTLSTGVAELRESRVEQAVLLPEGLVTIFSLFIGFMRYLGLFSHVGV
jgi:hypothetical protein